MNGPAISVCIASYNHEAFIGPCIESVLRQTFAPIDVVVVDDCSTDRTAEVVATFDDPRVRLVRHGTNKGPSVALNHAITLSRGDYVCIVGSDDTFEPTKLEAQCRALTEDPALGLVATFVQTIGETGEPISGSLQAAYTNVPQTREALLRGFFSGVNRIAAPSTMMRRTALDRSGLFDERLLQTQDLDLWIRILLANGVAVLPEPLLNYRVRNEQKNLSAASPEKTTRTLWEFERVLHRFRAIDRELLFEVFPELEDFRESPLSVDALLAWQALDTSATHTRNFGTALLFEVLGGGEDPAVLATAGLDVQQLFRSAALAAVYPRDGHDPNIPLLAAEYAPLVKAYGEVEEARDWWRATAGQWENQSREWQARALKLGWRD